MTAVARYFAFSMQGGRPDEGNYPLASHCIGIGIPGTPPRPVDEEQVQVRMGFTDIRTALPLVGRGGDFEEATGVKVGPKRNPPCLAARRAVFSL